MCSTARHFFNMKQDKNETLKRRLEKIGGHRDKCEFSSITTVEIITYKFAATIKDKKARDKFSKGPLKLKMVLETIELDNYNRKYGDKKQKIKKPGKGSSNSSSEDEQIAYTNHSRKRKTAMLEKKKISNRNCRFCGKSNWSLEHKGPARKQQCNNCKKMGHFAKLCKSRTINRVREAPTSESNSESWPKESVNAINRVDFYKAILLVQGQPIECIIDTGSPVSIIPPVIIPTEIKKASKSFVDVNKYPIKFEGKAMVEVKTEKVRKYCQYSKTKAKIHNHCWVWIGKTNWKSDCREPRKPTSCDILTQTKDERELSMNTKTYSKTSTQLKILRSISS